MKLRQRRARAPGGAAYRRGDLAEQQREETPECAFGYGFCGLIGDNVCFLFRFSLELFSLAFALLVGLRPVVDCFRGLFLIYAARH